MAKKLGYILLGLIALLFLVWPLFLHAAIAKKPGRDSIGALVYQDNPFTYKAGTVSVSGNLENAVVFRIQPIGTFALFTEDVLICGHPADLFTGKTNPLVLTYSTKASRVVEGVGCHTLVHVDSLSTHEVPQ
jgi:hypothetical protein